MNDIDKDIEKVRGLINYLKEDFPYNAEEYIQAIENVLAELEKKDKMINLILGEYIDNYYDFQFIEPNKRADKRIELINEYKEHYRKKVQK